MKKIIIIFIALLIISLSLGVYIWRIEPRWVEWNQYVMPITNLPESLVGKKLVQISDIHIGETVDEEYIIKQFKK